MSMPTSHTALLLAAGALTGAVIHLVLTLVYASDWQGDETRSRLALAGVALMLAVVMLMALAHTARAWSSLILRAISAVAGAVALAAAMLGVVLAANPSSDAALDTFNRTTIVLAAFLTVIGIGMLTVSNWPIAVRLACAPMAALLPIIIWMLSAEISWAWWFSQMLATTAVGLPAIAALGYRRGLTGADAV